MIDAFGRIFESTLPDFYRAREKEIAGVHVMFKPSSTAPSWSEWEDTLETYLPAFRDAGWTEDLESIRISRRAPMDGRAGTYWPGLIALLIDLPKEPENARWEKVVEESQRSALIHEMIHHAHQTVHGHMDTAGEPIESSVDQHFIGENVSEYATTNVAEAVAEIGCGIILGENYPDDVHEFYAEHGGPDEVYEVRNAC